MASPNRLKPYTASDKPKPGHIAIHGLRTKSLRPGPASMPPQDGSGAGTPKPMKLSEASVRIAIPSALVAMISHGATHCGAMCCHMIRRFTAPIARAASTYCASFTAKTCERTTRLARGICTMPMAMIMLIRFVPSAAVTAIASIRVGMDMSASINRCIALSTLPPYHPLITPITPPEPEPKATERKPTSSDMRAPDIMRL